MKRKLTYYEIYTTNNTNRYLKHNNNIKNLFKILYLSNDIIYNLTTNIPQLDNIDVEIDRLHNILDENEIV